MNDINNINFNKFIYKQTIKTAMERKLIKQGLGGYTIYLPKEWVTKKGLKGGDKVTIDETDTTLTIGSQVKGKKELTINIDNQNRKNVRNLLTHAYRRGFDKIRLTNIDPGVLKEAQFAAQNLLLGMEVTEHTDKSCTLENISEPTEEKYEVMLRRIFLIIKEMQNITINDFANYSFIHINEIETLRDQEDRYILFCRRILTKEKIERKSILEWELFTFLMHISHSTYYLYKYVAENKIEKDPSLAIVNDITKYFDMFYNAYFNKDIKLIHDINRTRDEYYLKKLPKLIENGKNAMIYASIREIFRLIQIGTSPILAEIIETSF